MIKSACLLVAFAALLFVGLPTLAYEGNPTPGKCQYHGIELTVDKYVPAPIGECLNVKCAENGGIEALPCPPLSGIPVGSKCHYVQEDLTKAYPDCCQRVGCGDK